MPVRFHICVASRAIKPKFRAAVDGLLRRFVLGLLLFLFGTAWFAFSSTFAAEPLPGTELYVRSEPWSEEELADETLNGI